MDNKEKKQTPFFKSVQISKEKKEKFFKVHKGSLKCDNQKKENVINNCSESNKEQSSNHFFITHKDIESNINKNSFDKINDVNNLNGIFIKNKNSSINNDNNNINENIYKSKLNIVYFESIKNLCDNLNQNFDELNRYENIIDINEYLTQMYLKLKILDRKILLLNKINKIKVSQEDLHILNVLLKHLLYMNKALNNNISNNIRIIYSNLNNLCDNFKG